jgi:hypothetical protein
VHCRHPPSANRSSPIINERRVRHRFRHLSPRRLCPGPGSSHLAFIPLLAGYRHTLNGSGTGFYLEPFAGYTIGGSDIEKTDANGNLLYNSDGSVQDQKISGATAGLGFGYLVPSASLPLNIGLRFEHVFVSGDPSQSLLSLRISWSLLTGRRLQQ